VLVRKFPSLGLNVAVTLNVPALANVNVQLGATPAVSVTPELQVPVGVAPATAKVTVPCGTAAPELAGTTVAVKVTGWLIAVAPDEARLVVVPSAFTPCARLLEVAEAKFVSPPYVATIAGVDPLETLLKAVEQVAVG
jgi:hypothetical protein